MSALLIDYTQITRTLETRDLAQFNSKEKLARHFAYKAKMATLFVKHRAQQKAWNIKRSVRSRQMMVVRVLLEQKAAGFDLIRAFTVSK